MKKRSDAAALFSHAEFDALPHSVQRKYFSSLERLRIADQQSLEDHHSLHYHYQLGSSRRSSRSHSRSIALQSSVKRALSRRRRLRKAESIQLEHDIAQQEVQFFLSLPPKLRKQHFSREEQALLAGRCEQPFLPDSHVHVQERAQQRFHDFHFGLDDTPPSTPEPERGRSRRRSRSLSPTRVPLDAEAQERDTEADADDSLVQIDAMSPPLSYRPTQAPPFRRTLSLTNVPVRHSTSSAPYMAEPTLVPFSPLQRHHRAASLSFTGRRSSHTPVPTAPVIDPEATHYQDPEARKKLRMFASAQKFDEAVEFGFPSRGAGEHTPTPRYHLPPITTDARNFSRDMQTFLREDTISFLDDDGDGNMDTDGESVTDADSPMTPSSAAGLSFRCHTRHASPSNFSSTGSQNHSPVQLIPGPRLNREMTLRMTLTRPDLRADEEQLYGWQGQGQGQKQARDDPFALEELQLSDDMTGSKSPFFVKPKGQGNLVSRLFKRASKRSR